MAGRPGQGQIPPSAFATREFLDIIMRAAHDRIVAFMRVADVSRTLQETLANRTLSNTHGQLFLPYYWAEFVHGGRGRVHAKPGKFMVFFPDKRDDPRTFGGRNYPKRPGDRPSLTKADLQKFSKENKRRLKTGEDPIMVFAKSVGPGKPGNQGVPGKLFFTNAMAGFPVPSEVQRITDHLTDIIRTIAPNGSRKITIRAGR